MCNLTFNDHPTLMERESHILLLCFVQGYAGLILRESKHLESVQRTLKPTVKFDKFTYWNWDRQPSAADKYQQALNWIDISSVVSHLKLEIELTCFPI